MQGIPVRRRSQLPAAATALTLQVKPVSLLTTTKAYIINLVVVVKRHKAEAARLSGGRVPHHARLLHAPKLVELLLQLLRRATCLSVSRCKMLYPTEVWQWLAVVLLAALQLHLLYAFQQADGRRLALQCQCPPVRCR